MHCARVAPATRLPIASTKSSLVLRAVAAFAERRAARLSPQTPKDEWVLTNLRPYLLQADVLGQRRTASSRLLSSSCASRRPAATAGVKLKCEDDVSSG